MCAGALCCAQAQLPDVPQVAVENLPPRARNAINKAFLAASKNPRNADANGTLGMVLYAHGFLPEAGACFRRAHALDRSSARWAYFLGIEEAAQGRNDEAVAALRDSARLDPTYRPAQFALGEALLATARWDDAARLYRALVQKHPDLAAAYYGLGRAQAVRSDLTGAAASLAKACELFPVYGPAYYALAQTHKRMGKEQEALRELAAFESHKLSRPAIPDPMLDEIAALQGDADNNIRRGVELARSGRLDEAVAALRSALQSNPDLAPAHAQLVVLYGRLGRFQDAQTEFDAAVQLDPRNALAYFGHALALAAQNRFAEAEAELRKTLDIDPSYPDGTVMLGQMLEAQGRPTEALAEYRRAALSNPTDPRLDFGIGRILVNQEQYEEGLKYLLKSVETRDQNSRPSYVYAVGAAYARAGKTAEALRYLRDAQRLASTRGQTALADRIEQDINSLKTEGRAQ